MLHVNRGISTWVLYWEYTETCLNLPNAPKNCLARQWSWYNPCVAENRPTAAKNLRGKPTLSTTATRPLPLNPQSWYGNGKWSISVTESKPECTGRGNPREHWIARQSGVSRARSGAGSGSCSQVYKEQLFSRSLMWANQDARSCLMRWEGDGPPGLDENSSGYLWLIDYGRGLASYFGMLMFKNWYIHNIILINSKPIFLYQTIQITGPLDANEAYAVIKAVCSTASQPLLNITPTAKCQVPFVSRVRAARMFS